MPTIYFARISEKKYIVNGPTLNSFNLVWEQVRSLSSPFQSSDWRIRRWNRQYYGFTQHKSRTIESNSALIQIVWADLSDVHPTTVNIPTTETVSQSLTSLWWYVKNHMWTKRFKRIHWLTLDFHVENKQIGHRKLCESIYLEHWWPSVGFFTSSNEPDHYLFGLWYFRQHIFVVCIFLPTTWWKCHFSCGKVDTRIEKDIFSGFELLLILT